MHGIDLTKISRFENVNETFLKKVLSPEELIEYEEVQNKAKYVAGRWAIKEALFKADNSLSTFHKINIVKKNRTYIYSGYIITTTNEGDYYLASVIKEK